MALGNFRRISLGTLVSLTILAGSVMGLRHAWVGYQNSPLSPRGAKTGYAFFSPANQHMVVNYKDGFVRVWDLHCNMLFEKRFGDGIPQSGFSPDGTFYVSSGGDDDQTSFFDKQWRQTGQIPGFLHCFSRGGKIIVTEKLHGKILHVWELPDCRKVAQLGNDDAEIWSADFSPDGELVVTRSADHTARIWDARSGTVLAVLQHNALVKDVYWSADGRYILTMAHDGYARIWNPETGNQLWRLGGVSTPILTMQFLADGRRVAVSALDGLIIWDAETGAYKEVFEKVGEEWSLLSGETFQVVTNKGAEVWNFHGKLLANIEADSYIGISDTASELRLILVHMHEEEITELFVREGDSMKWTRFRTPYQRGLLIFFLVLTALVAAILGRCLWRDYKTLRGPARQEQKLGD